MAKQIRLTTPLSDGDVENLRIGDKVLLNGVFAYWTRRCT